MPPGPRPRKEVNRMPSSYAKLPWFCFEATTWLSDPYVRLMSARQRGWYIDLLCWAWQEGGFRPQDAEIICQVLRERSYMEYKVGTQDQSLAADQEITEELDAVVSHFTF